MTSGSTGLQFVKESWNHCYCEGTKKKKNKIKKIKNTKNDALFSVLLSSHVLHSDDIF